MRKKIPGFKWTGDNTLFGITVNNIFGIHGIGHGSAMLHITLPEKY
jgi:hypothetical protein